MNATASTELESTDTRDLLPEPAAVLAQSPPRSREQTESLLAHRFFGYKIALGITGVVCVGASIGAAIVEPKLFLLLGVLVYPIAAVVAYFFWSSYRMYRHFLEEGVPIVATGEPQTAIGAEIDRIKVLFEDATGEQLHAKITDDKALFDKMDTDRVFVLLDAAENPSRVMVVAPYVEEWMDRKDRVEVLLRMVTDSYVVRTSTPRVKGGESSWLPF